MDDDGSEVLSRPVRLDRNEVPFLPPANVIAGARVGLQRLNRYAEPQDLEQLSRFLADYAGIPQEQIVIGPGSDILLREIVYTFARERNVIMVSPSFLPTVEVAREVAGQYTALRVGPPTFALRPGLLLSATREPCLVIVDSPNNPTGQIMLVQETVQALVQNPETLLVIDEAYHEFAEMSLPRKRSGRRRFVDLVEDYENLAVTRTMDKAFGLAGARVGYAVVGKAFRDAFTSFHPFLPQPSLCAALEALKHPAYMWENVERLIEERERLREALQDMGALVHPSTANFLLVRASVSDMAARLQDRGVLVSDVSNQLPPGFIRVSVGTRPQNDAFLAAFRESRGERRAAGESLS